jgi:hypothetical protein
MAFRISRALRDGSDRARAFSLPVAGLRAVIGISHPGVASSLRSGLDRRIATILLLTKFVVQVNNTITADARRDRNGGDTALRRALVKVHFQSCPCSLTTKENLTPRRQRAERVDREDNQ